MIDKKALVVFSGGLDSTTCVYWAKQNYREVETLTFNYGSRQNDVEYSYVETTCNKLGIKNTRIEFDFMKKYFKSSLLDETQDIPEGEYDKDNMASTVVPFRNGIMLSIAAGFAESRDCDVLVLGNHHTDSANYPDCTKEFTDSIADAIKFGTFKQIEVVSPFCEKTKTDIVKVGAELGVDFTDTYSCYNGRELHCGKCTTCQQRKDSFKEAGIIDPTIYEQLVEV